MRDDLPTDSKQQIIRWCREDDQQAFRHFYRAQSGKLWKFLIARGCDRDTAYDLLAEAFLRFIGVVCRDPYAPVALLYRIALNLKIDTFRRNRASPVDTWAELPESAAPAANEETADIQAIISLLPDTEQNLLLLRYWIGLSHKEVAQALDMPEGTVRRQCAELLEKLRKRLDEHEQRR